MPLLMREITVMNGRLIDTQQPPLEIEQGATGIPGIDRGIGLYGIGIVPAHDPTGAEHAGGHGGDVVEIAEREAAFPNAAHRDGGRR